MESSLGLAEFGDSITEFWSTRTKQSKKTTQTANNQRHKTQQNKQGSCPRGRVGGGEDASERRGGKASDRKTASTSSTAGRIEAKISSAERKWVASMSNIKSVEPRRASHDGASQGAGSAGPPKKASRRVSRARGPASPSGAATSGSSTAITGRTWSRASLWLSSV